MLSPFILHLFPLEPKVAHRAEKQQTKQLPSLDLIDSTKCILSFTFTLLHAASAFCQCMYQVEHIVFLCFSPAKFVLDGDVDVTSGRRTRSQSRGDVPKTPAKKAEPKKAAKESKESASKGKGKKGKAAAAAAAPPAEETETDKADTETTETTKEEDTTEEKSDS